MSKIDVPVSLGEIADKISILEVKSKYINDSKAIENINREKKALFKACDEAGIDFGVYLEQLITVNEKLWDILQKQRDKELIGELDEEFVQLSIDVYKTNDQRFEVKREINKNFNSTLIEEKYYKKEL